jgi:HAD superfamily hydrolase (TIGR01549 family)
MKMQTQDLKINAIIFDLDGTIADSKLDFDQMRADIGIPKGEPILEYLEGHQDSHFVQRAYQIIHEHELKGAREATIIRDFANFYEFLNCHQIPTGILTRNSKEIADLTLSRLGLSFEHVYSRDCCLPKPHPDGLLRMSKVFKIHPHAMMYVGDFHFDIQTVYLTSEDDMH